MLRVENVTCTLGGRLIIDHVSTVFHPGLFHVIVGPNGSGKSTFLKLFSGDLAPGEGAVYYDGQPIRHQDKAALAKKRAVMSQLPELHFPLPVEEIVLMGRYPHFALRPRSQDLDICRQAMALTEVAALVGRDYLTLSGGERQRVQFARALAQVWEAPSDGGNRYLFLDEPISSLDMHFQHQFLQIARSLLGDNLVLVAVLHDLNLSLQYADRILFMKDGRIAAEGEAPGIVTPELVRDVFQMPVRLLENPYGGAPVIVPA